MKTKHLISIVFMSLIALCSVSFAQTVVDVYATQSVASTPSAHVGITASNIVSWLTPILVPLLIAGVKMVSPRIPSWTLPLIAPVLGMLLDLVSSMATSHSSNLALAALLGLAGVGIREVKDQIKPAQPLTV